MRKKSDERTIDTQQAYARSLFKRWLCKVIDEACPSKRSILGIFDRDLERAIAQEGAPVATTAQAPAVSQAPARITAALDANNLVRLRGNVHPLARAEFDRGLAGDGMVLHRILLLLQPSDEQKAALAQLIGEQKDRASSRFHQWLNPEQFGAQFGPADADVAAVTQWLSAAGFTDIRVGTGRTVVEFTGSAGAVREAFHTEIHRYTVKTGIHYANATDPEIPAALAPVVAGVVALNNFPVQSHIRALGTFRKSLKTGETRPLFTFPGCTANGCFGVAPIKYMFGSFLPSL
jgi:hypothetical protein